MHTEQFSSKTIQGKNSFIQRQIAGSSVLISVRENIANFNGHIEMNEMITLL